MVSTKLISSGKTARLSVNLGAIKANYNILRALAGSADCVGIVKANAYGMGMDAVSKALWSQGCRTYGVALLSEAAVLRQYLPDADIFVLNGLMKGAAGDYHHLQLRPALASIEEVEEWSLYCRTNEVRLPAAIHVDTGINRLGIEYEDAITFFQNDHACEDFELCMLMSHLACADEPTHPLNQKQIEKFTALRSCVPNVKFSLANSAGIISGPNAHFDVIRPGISLYGSNPIANSVVNLERVMTLEASVMQIRTAAMGQSVGYRETFVCQRPTKIAIIGLGYADGYPYSLSGTNSQTKAYVSISGHRAPIIGRVSMDMLGVDVTDLPEQMVSRAMMVEMIGENISLDGVAQASESNSYEVLARLGNRFERVYT